MSTELGAEEIKNMRIVGKLAARTLEHVGTFVKAGITTNELDQIVYDYTMTHNAVPAPLNYGGYPKSCCTSVNEVICHGVPNETILKDGDAINVDVTTILNGMFGDTSKTFYVGNVSQRVKDVTECALSAMEKGIEAIRPNGTTGDIGFAINKFVTRQGFFPVREIGGHGIGRKFHEDPFVPSFGKKGRGDILRPNHCITVEPMINETDMPLKEFDIPNSSIKWYETGDKTLSAQFEHTILITQDGYEVLTLP